LISYFKAGLERIWNIERSAHWCIQNAHETVCFSLGFLHISNPFIFHFRFYYDRIYELNWKTSGIKIHSVLWSSSSGNVLVNRYDFKN
jgi:hypothetical protein